MSQYNGNVSQPKPQPKKQGIPGIFYVAAALLLGIFILISGIIIGSNLKKLAAAIEGQTFTDSFTSPDTLKLNTATEKKYLSREEAAEYLNVSEDEISTAISNGEIDEYMITSKGYAISIASLDDYFTNKAYEIQQKANESANSESE